MPGWTGDVCPCSSRLCRPTASTGSARWARPIWALTPKATHGPWVCVWARRCGAPVVIFLTTAQQTDLQTATGAVMLTAIFYFIVLPVFARCLRFFPKLVIGTMLLLVAVNLVKVYGGIITGAPGSPNFATAFA